MPLVEINFKPGIFREGTPYAEKASWYDCDKIRFRAGRPEKIGGWVSASEERMKGVTRVMHNWSLLNGKDCLALGTNKKFYVEESGRFYDITPVRFSNTTANPITTGAAGTFIHTYTTGAAHNAAPGDYVRISGCANVDALCTDTYTNPFTTTAAGSGSVVVNTLGPHYANAGDTVTFSGTTGFDGIPAGNFNTSLVIQTVLSPTSYTVQVATNATAGFVNGGGAVTAVYLARLNREFEIIATPTATTFTFRTDKAATTGAVNGGGAAVTAAFQISIGFSINVIGGGWGTEYWGRNEWGSPRTTTVSGITLRTWSVDNYGEDLVFCTRDGPLYYWDSSAGFGQRGQLIASMVGAVDVPIQTSIVKVTEDRHVVAIGTTSRITTAFDPLLIRWSNQEDYIDWGIGVGKTAGGQRIPLGSYVVAAIAARQETLIWTDRSLHSLQFTGPPSTFGLQTLAENINIAGPNAAVNVNNVTYWMGINKFWVYSGRAETMACSVQRFVFDNINRDQQAQVYAFKNEEFAEVTWFYCDNTSTQINRYVTYNYEQDIWYYGSISRTAAIQCPGRGGFPYATAGGENDDGRLFIHEVGVDDGSVNPPAPIAAYVESADFSIGIGDRIAFADRLIPDVTFAKSQVDTPSVRIEIQAKKFPGDAIQNADSRAVAKVASASVDRFTRQVWVRLRGREMRMRVSSDGQGVSWLLGTTRLNVRADGVQ